MARKLRIKLLGKPLGFTLVELMVVVSIIAILTTIGTTVYNQTQKAARNSKVISDLKAIGEAYEIHYDASSAIYSPISSYQFADGNIPKLPNGSAYNFVSGPNSANPSACNGIKICAPLEGGDPNCNNSSATCHCYIGLQGAHDCFLAVAPPPPPGPISPPGPPGPPSVIPPIAPPVSTIDPPTNNWFINECPTLNPNQNKRAFVTLSGYQADFGGATIADGLCQNEANINSLGGQWKAWISDANSTVNSRFNMSSSYKSNNFITLDCTKIANNWNGLESGSLLSPINISVDKSRINYWVWTDTHPDGSLIDPALSCNNWTSKETAKKGLTGISSAANTNWTYDSPNSCDNYKHLYCVEQ